MTRRAALAATLAAAGAARAALPARDWTRTAVRQADGSFVQGNPAAKVKLVEILSLTCPHCAHFEAEAAAPLTARYIRPGLVSYEVRHYVRDSFDMAASLLTRCAGPVAFFDSAPIVFAQQGRWLGQAGRFAQSNPKIEGLTPSQQLQMLARGAGLTPLMQTRGIAPAKANQCLADTSEQMVLAKSTERQESLPGFPGTPTFLINGAMQQGIGSWAELDKRITAALR